MSSRTRQRLAAALGLGLAATSLQLLTSPVAGAAPGGTGLVISEVYGGGGNSGSAFSNDFIELYNPTAAPVDVAGWAVQYFSATGGSGGTVNLSGSVPAGGHYLVQLSAGTTVTDKPLPAPVDATGSINMGAGRVFLLSSTTPLANGGTGAVTPGAGAYSTVVDMVGFNATAASYEGSGPVAAPAGAGSSVQRVAPGFGDTDDNQADFVNNLAPTPTNASTSAEPGDTPVVATVPGSRSGRVGQAITPFTLAATGGSAPYTWDATGLPPGLQIAPSGEITGTPTTVGDYTVTATVTDSTEPTAGEDDVEFTFAVTAALAPRPIAEIQGTNAPVSPIRGEEVLTEGVVTAVYTTGGLNGFNIQTAGTGSATDNTPGASDGIFVYGGSGGFASYPAVGDSVRVTGTVAEFETTSSGVVTSSLTQLTSATWEAVASLGSVTALDTPWFTTDAAREAHEGELIDPSNSAFTVTNSYATWQYGEVGLATGETPLVQPTEVEDVQTGDPASIAAQNAERLVTLDDGKSLNFGGSSGNNVPSSWVDKTHPVRAGGAATLKGAFVVDHRNGLYKLQPIAPVDGLGADVAEFENTRVENAAPAAVGGDVRIATFNVLNYFPTTAADYVAAGGGNVCTYFNDRAGNPIGANQCGNPSATSGNGPRGAANKANFERQQAKIVAAINGLTASIVSLEELENSVKFGKSRDDAIGKLVAALNAASQPGTWAYVPSPAAADLPAPAQEDVIRTGFIYKPADVRPVGSSMVLKDETNFDNAREPLAQAFKRKGAPNSQAFGVIVNHFKSKGDSNPPATGGNANGIQGAFNADRIGQAQALLTFADTFKTARGVQALFLAGDFNSYSKEDPVQVIEAGGYTQVESGTAGEETYYFNGLAGSLDHVYANAAAAQMVTGADIWNINSPETVGFQYGRYNYNVTDFYEPNQFAASDHDPEIVGLDLTPEPAAEATINLLNINDFHGRIDANTTKFATTIEQLRDATGEDQTLFLSAGDNIGASLFASSLQDDDPTIEVLNALDLRTSAVGNHEFDQGFADLTDDVEQAADFSYLGANVYAKGTQTPALDEYATFEVDGVTVGVIGVVTQETPSLVTPTGVADLTFGDPVAAVNRVAGELSDGNAANGEADVIVAEYHEGAGSVLADSASCAQEIASNTAFGRIARETAASVDVIFTGHTHKQYACDGPIPGLSGKTRPIVQTGSYGERIGQVVLKVDRAAGTVSSYVQGNVVRAATEDLSYPRVQAVKTITDAALANAATVGNQPVGRIAADITRAFSNGASDDRSSESTLGALAAQALRDGVADLADADLGVINPGGLREDLRFAGDTTTNPANTDGVVTYAEANAVMTFNNTVALVDLSGADFKAVLEEQWQTAAPGAPAPSRPYLQLGLSDNVRVTADPTKPAGERITSVHIDGEPLDPAKVYKISTLSFLATGGDNFRAFTKGTYIDTGRIDIQLFRDYLRSASETTPIAPEFARQQVFQQGLPTELVAGQTTSFTLGLGATSAPVYPLNPKTLDLTSLGSPANTVLEMTGHFGGAPVDLGDVAVTNGVADVALTVPASAAPGGRIELVAQPSGTTVTIPVGATVTETTVAAQPVSMVWGQAGSVTVTVSPAGATGTVEIRSGATVLGTGAVSNGTVTVPLPATSLDVGTHTLTAAFTGSGSFGSSSTTVTVTVVKATTSISADDVSISYGRSRTVSVKVDPAATGTVEVKDGARVLGSAAVANGVATVTLPKESLEPGRTTLTAAYSGDGRFQPASTTLTANVAKAQSRTNAKVKPAKVVAKRTRATLSVEVDGLGGVDATGKVKVSVPGQGTETVTLRNGRAVVRLGAFPSAGKRTISVQYLGSDLLERSSDKVVVSVRRK